MKPVTTKKLAPIDAADTAAWPEGISAPARRLLEYWRAQCSAGRYPWRTEIDPTALQEVLPWIFIVEILPTSPADYRFQLVGTRIVEIEGECTGQLLSDLVPDRDEHARLWKQYDAASKGEILIRYENLGWREKKHVDYEVVLLPLRGDTDDAGFLIGAAYALLTAD